MGRRAASQTPERRRPASPFRQRPLYDVGDVGRARGGCRHAPQGRLGARAALRLEHAPALERGEQPRCELRILGIEREHRVRDEVIAGAVGSVEFLLVRHRERADQGADAVGIREGEGRMRGERLDAIKRRRLGYRGLQREPLVDDERIAGIAGVEIVERYGTSASDSADSAAMRSVMLSAAWYWRAASAIASGRRVATRRSRQMLRNARRPALAASGRYGRLS